MRKDRRGAFKTWKRSLLGNHAFLMAVLRNGFFDITSQQELMVAVLQEQSNSGGDHPAEHDREERRRDALEAYGYGVGAKITTKEEAAVFRMSYNAIDAQTHAYFGR